jgi:hypothetical protein
MPDTDYPIMPDFKFTSNGIEKLLKGLNAYKAPGPDQLCLTGSVPPEAVL